MDLTPKENDLNFGDLAVLIDLSFTGGRSEGLETAIKEIKEQRGLSKKKVVNQLRHLEEVGLIKRKTESRKQIIELTIPGQRLLAREFEKMSKAFTPDQPLILEGAVTEGLGKGREFVSLSGYSRQFQEKLGYKPFPGTLNVDLTDDSVMNRYQMDFIDGIHIESWEEGERKYGAATCYPVRIESTTRETYEPAHIIIPYRTAHDDDQIEIIAESELRHALYLENEGVIEVHVLR